MVVMLRQCCCGCSLKTGTIIIGVLNLIGSCFGVGGGIMIAQKDPDFKTVGIVQAVFSAIMVIICILLILGTIKDRPALLMPWIIITIISTIALIILYITAAVRFFNAGDSVNGITYILSAIIGCLLQIYFILVVYSLYRELKGTA